MAYRFKTNTNIAAGGTTLAHGLGAFGTPDEITVTPSVPLGAGQTYRYAASDSTNIYLAQGTSATSADVVARIGYSTNI